MIFAFLRERMWNRLQGWHGKLLSQDGKEVLIKTVAQAIPTFCMSSFLIPISLCQELERMMNSFWWGTKSNGERCIHWIKWNTLCPRKEQGGMGFRSLHAFNLAMPGKHAWNFISNPYTLASRLIKAKYFPHGNFLSAQLGSNPSYTWKSIWSSQFILKQGCRWCIGDESSINIWHEPWLKDDTNLRVVTPMIEGIESLRVQDLFIMESRYWDVELIEDLYFHMTIKTD